MICKWVYIRGRAFNSWGVGRVGDFEKKNPASACRKKKNCMQHKCNRKKFLRCCKKEKKCCKAISSFREALQNRSKTATILFPCSLWTLDSTMLQNYCFICAMHYKLITSSIIYGGKFFLLKNQVLIDNESYFFAFLTETFLWNYFLFKYNIFAMPFFSILINIIFFLSFSNATINV